MRKLFFAAVLFSFIVGAGDVLDACGSKFLVGASSNPRYARVLASVEPTKILVYWPQDENTPDEDIWQPRAEEWLENEVGHTVEVALDHDAFLGAAENGDFEVVMVMPIEEARAVQAEVATLLPDAAVLPIAHMATRREMSAAKKEFSVVLKSPTTMDKFLQGIEKARSSRE